jgi:hypothetical protein
MGKNTRYTFVVDTRTHVVNFMDAMFSSLTGQIPTRFSAYADKLRAETFKKNDRIVEWLNAYFCDNISRCHTLIAPDGVSDSLGIQFKERPPSFILHGLTSRAIDFCKKGRDTFGRRAKIPFVGCRLIKTTEVQEVETIA